MTVTDDSLAQWVVGLVATGVVSVAGFLVRQTLGDLRDAVLSNTKEVVALGVVVNAGKTDHAVLRAEFDALAKRVDQLERDSRQLREG